jgi:iron complex outermembrane receptor protein
MRTILVWTLLAITILARRAQAQTSTASPLAGASLEELMNIEVTSVSKKEQTLSQTGAAVFVIGQEDIRRSGAANIPDLLRLAPGVEVAQIDANRWAISIRGFNDLYSNKVLVLIDGRTVYVNTFSGVFWDQINVPLEDIERIEIIRGPGGTMWGANAVNGVINIITKSAADTKGGLVTVSSGSKQTADGLAQYGADAGSNGAYRVFGRYFNVDNSVFPGGQRAADGWHGEQAGARADFGLSSQDTLSVQGDFLSSWGGGTSTATFAGPPPFQAEVNNALRNTSGDMLARWEHMLANGSSTSLQIYDNVIDRSEAAAHLGYNALDLEFQHHFAAGSRHDVVWGLDYRTTRNDEVSDAGYSLRLTPALSTENLFAAFIQDEIRLGESVFLTVGSKLEHNGFTGFEYEPSIQTVWKINDRHSVWASAARAIREPSLLEHDLVFDYGVTPVSGNGPALVVLSGSPAARAERLNDYEAGYRAQVNRRLSVDLTAFLSFYQHLQTQEPGTPYLSVGTGEPLLVVPVTLANLAHARDYGAELFANWKVTGRWKVSPGFSMLRMSVQPDASSQDSRIAQTPGYSPRQQFEVRSMLSLRKNLEWDSSLKYVGRLDALNIPGYARLDARLGWHPAESWELSISGQNLTAARHLEFVDDSGLFLRTEVARTVSGKVTWRF